MQQIFDRATEAGLSLGVSKNTAGLAGAVVVGLSTIGVSKFNKNRRIAHKKEQEKKLYDLVIDINSVPTMRPWNIELNKKYERDVDTLAISIMGDYKVGKTFLLNRMCGLNLPSAESQHTKGLSFKRMDPPHHQMIWIDTAGQGAPYNVKQESIAHRQSTENLVNELAYHISDVRIVVVSNCKLRDQEFIYSIHKSIQGTNQPSRSLLVVVHNYCRIADPQLLITTFKNDVVARFGVEEVKLPSWRSNDTKIVWVERNDGWPIYHFILGKEGTKAGNAYNSKTYEAIFEMCSYRVGVNSRHNFIQEIVQLSNVGLLLQHMGCPTRVIYDEANMQVKLETDTTTSTTTTTTTNTNNTHTSSQVHAVPHHDANIPMSLPNGGAPSPHDPQDLIRNVLKQSNSDKVKWDASSALQTNEKSIK